jgi:flagellar biosynthesis component FlhA
MSAIVKALDKLSKNVPKKLPGLGNMNAILHNRTFLYIVFAFSLLNLYVFTVNSEFVFITFFILFGFLTSFFSKNMVVILLLSAVLTNTIKYGSNLYEGLENEDDEEEKKEEKEEKEENMENQDDDAVAENMENKEEDKETSKDSKDSKDSNIQSQILSNIKKMNEYLQKLTLSPKVDETKVSNTTQ